MTEVHGVARRRHVVPSKASGSPLHAVILGSADSSFNRQVLEPVLDELGLLDSVCFQKATESQALNSSRTNVFVFLIDQQQLDSQDAVRATFVAIRRAMSGDALIVPVVMDGELDFSKSALAFLSPLQVNRIEGGKRLTESSSKEMVKRLLDFSARETVSQTSTQRIQTRLSQVTQIAEAVDPLPCHMSNYDDFVEQLVARLQVMRMSDRRRNLNIFSEALRQVLNAEMVYCYFRSKNGDLHLYEADSNRTLHHCTSSQVHGVLEEALQGYADGGHNRSLRLQNFLPQLAPAGGSAFECMVIANERLPNCGVFVAVRDGLKRFPMTEVLSTVINSLHDALAWANFESFEKLKARVYDDLKQTYRFVSSDMYEDRRRIFKNQLNGINVHFEPMFQFDPVSRAVDVFAYEALAREHVDSNAAPVEIFNAASLWGMGFQLEVDSVLLDTTIKSYVNQLQGSVIDSGSIKPLSLNVFPATLRSSAYRELLYEVLARSAPLSGRHLIMEVSEKTVVSPELQIEARQQLEEYREVVRQLTQLTGVKFAIDDFGVGNASLSRLDSLKPHFVKIDRDILSFDTRMADTLIRYLVQSQRELGTAVILEGVDIHSKLSLDELVSDIGVGLIQGHSLSKAVRQFDAAWETQVCDKIKTNLGWSTSPQLTRLETSVVH